MVVQRSHIACGGGKAWDRHNVHVCSPQEKWLIVCMAIQGRQCLISETQVSEKMPHCLPSLPTEYVAEFSG